MWIVRDGEGWQLRSIRDGEGWSKKPFRVNFGFGPFKPTELVLQNGPEK